MFKWMAAVAMDMEADLLVPYLPVMLPPLLRDSSEKSTTAGNERSMQFIDIYINIIAMVDVSVICGMDKRTGRIFPS